VAPEPFAFCLDNVGQGPGAIRRHATDLPGAPIWSFWWGLTVPDAGEEPGMTEVSPEGGATATEPYAAPAKR
jgi:Domain of unknown function (DUF4253)